MDDVTERAAQIVEELPDGADATEDEVADRLEAYMEHDLSMATAADAVTREYGGGSGAMPDDDPEDREIASLDTEGEPVNIEGRVVDLWDPNHESIYQTGLIGDESGVTKFTEFKSDGESVDLEEDKSYRIENASTDEWEGDYNILIEDDSAVTELDEDVEVTDDDGEQDTVTISGAIVNVPDRKNGLIRRRVGDDRIVDSDSDAETEYDLRIKAHLDDGDECRTVYFDAEQTTELTGIDVEEAREIATDKLSIEAVIGQMKPDVLGRYFTLEVVQIEDNHLVESYECSTVSDPAAEAEELLGDMEVGA